MLLTAVSGVGAAHRTAIYAKPRLRFSYRTQARRRFEYQSYLKLRVQGLRPPYAADELTIAPFTHETMSREELSEFVRYYRNYYDEFGERRDYPFNHGVWQDGMSDIRARGVTRQVERDEGLISDIQLDFIDTTLKISGRKLFELGYTTKTYENPLDEGLAEGQDDFNMDQETQIRVEGTVAKRVTVNVDYDDTRENDSRNILSLIYEGKEDEFIRRGELGDVSLTLPGTRFVSFSTRSLFGAKIQAGLGDWLTLTLIGSREKGISEEEEYSGTSQLQRLDIEDVSYSQYSYYRLDTNPAHFNSASTIQVAEDTTGNAVIDVYLYESDMGYQSGITYYPDLVADIYDDGSGGADSTPPTGTGETVESQFWQKLEPVTDYSINKSTGQIDFRSSLSSYDYVAISYGVAPKTDPTNQIYSVGYSDSPAGLENAKLIKSGASNADLFDYMRHNIYWMQGSNLNLDSDFILQIFDLQGRDQDADDFDGDGDTEELLIETFGLTIPGDPNNRIDTARIIDPVNGLIIFPDDFPFQKDGEVGTDNDAYDESYSRRNHRFNIHVEYRGGSGVRFLKPNIIPGSEEVTLNGRRLVRDVDYFIDYDSGYIEFLIPGADDSDADLKIKYEYQPLFGDAGKTLAGGRLQFAAEEWLKIGGTYIGEWTDKPTDKTEIPELRGIPAAHQIFDADLQFSLANQFMTDAINLLPFIDSKTQSSIKLEGEIAYSLFDPNRVGRAHIDDLESAHQTIAFPSDPKSWGLSSAPLDISGNEYDRTDRWRITTDELDYDSYLISSEWEGLIKVLSLTDLPENDGGWDSYAKLIAANGLDLTERNLKYLEFYIRLPSNYSYSGARLHFDLGLINEDADGDYDENSSDPYSGYDTEDVGETPGIQGTFESGELDGRLQSHEDEGWTYNGGFFNKGYTDTQIGADNNLLDTEDLDANLVLDRANQYYGYSLPLDNLPDDVIGRELSNDWYAIRIPLDLDETRDWDQSPPVSNIVKTLRFWIESTEENGLTGNEKIYLYSLRLGGVRWREPEADPEDPLNILEVGTINSEQSAEYEALEQRTDDSGLPVREQALELKYQLAAWEDFGFDGVQGDAGFSPDDPGDNLPDYGENDQILNTEDGNHNGLLDAGEDIGWSGYDPGDTGAGNGVLDTEDDIAIWTTQQFVDPRDFSSHETIAVWVNNRNPDRSGMDRFFLRLGIDKSNYYQIEAPLTTVGWQQITVPLTDIYALRQAYEAFDPDDRPLIYKEGNLIVAGTPDMVRVYEISVGLVTNSPMDAVAPGEDPEGRIWVNNIDLLGSVVREGQAQRGAVIFQFGDVLNLRGDYTKIESDFQSIGSQRSGRTSESYAAAGTFNLDKFFPSQWMVSMPLTASWTRSDSYVDNIADYEGSTQDLGRTLSDTIDVGWSFRKTTLPSLRFAYNDYSAFNESSDRHDDRQSYSGSFDYSILSELFFVPSKINVRYLKRFDRVTYGGDSGYSNSRTTSDEFSSSVTWQFIRGMTFSPSFSFTDTQNLLYNEPISYSHTSRASLSYSHFRLIQPSISVNSTYTERFNSGGGYYDDSYDVGVNNSLSISSPLALGTLVEKFWPTWTTSLSYSLRHNSSYNGVTELPDDKYRFGLDLTWEGAGEAAAAGSGYSYLVSNRFRPIEFLSQENDILLAQIKYSFSSTISETFGTRSESWTEIWPSAELTITGHKYFPVFASLLQRSTVKLSFDKSTTKWIGQSLTRTYTPSVSWRATWSDALSSRVEYRETTSIVDELYDPFGFGDGAAHRVTTTVSPSASLTYNVELPGNFRIPFLGGDLTVRNELSLTASYNLSQVSGNKDSGTDATTRHTFSLSAGYYLTTSVHTNLTLTYEDYANEDQVGYNYNSLNGRLALEIKF